jgi:amino acid permease
MGVAVYVETDYILLLIKILSLCLFKTVVCTDVCITSQPK